MLSCLTIWLTPVVRHDLPRGGSLRQRLVRDHHLRRHPERIRHVPARECLRHIPEGDHRGGRTRWGRALANAVAGHRSRESTDPRRADGVLLHLDVERVPHPAHLPHLRGEPDGPCRDQRAAGRPADGRHHHERLGTAGSAPDAHLLPHLPAHAFSRHHGRSSQVMKFTDGFWQVRPGVDPLYGREVYDLAVVEDAASWRRSRPRSSPTGETPSIVRRSQSRCIRRTKA